jgi:hypothetical protein
MAKRLFWLTVGAAGATVAYAKGKKTVEKYLPEQVAKRAEKEVYSFGNRLKDAGKEFVEVFEHSRKNREAELTTALLAEGQTLAAGRAAHENLRAGAPLTHRELEKGHHIIEMQRVTDEGKE